MEHLLRGVRPQGEQLPGNEETSEAKVGKKLENPWDNPIYYAINASMLFVKTHRHYLSLLIIGDW